MEEKAAECNRRKDWCYIKTNLLSSILLKRFCQFRINIQLITNTNDYDYLAYKKIKDIVVDKGPLGGIYTALVHSETEMNLILSCDIPLISTEMLQELIEKHTANFDVSVFEDNDRIHPLIGIYSKKSNTCFKKSN